MKDYLLLYQVFTVWSVVEAEHDGQPYGQGRGPAQQDDDVGRGVVMSVLRVKDGRCNRKEPDKKQIFYFLSD